MKLFDARPHGPLSPENVAAIKAAEDYAAQGEQALHVWDPGPDVGTDVPWVFRGTRPWAHLFDQNESRLIRTATLLGIRKIVIGRKGRPGQHIDLCGVPLQKALALCKREAEAYSEYVAAKMAGELDR